jgi:glutathione S-transferase
MTIELYEFGPTRSARVRWTLLELDIPFESHEGRHLIGSDELKKVHPLGKLPVLIDAGRPLFESFAICTWLADSHPDKGLIAASGTWQRAQHDQWCAYVMTEVEAHLWSSARNTFVYPEDKRIKAVFAQNNAEVRRALAPLDDHLSKSDYLVGDAFSVADIFCGYALNWARMTKLTDQSAAIDNYLRRLQARPHCTLSKD